MAVSKVVLFYVFTPLADPEAIRLWQRELCRSLGLRGRILISPQGINATVGGELDAVKRYLRTTREYSPFAGMDVKWGEGSGLDPATADAAAPHGYSVDFPKLSAKVREELVTFAAPGDVVVDESGVRDGGVRLSPDALHELVAERGEDVVFLDGRNDFEARIGRSRGAIVPGARTTRDFVKILDSGALDDMKSKPVVTYCTGGIRCEVLSALLRSRGFEEVYQLDGGILRYGEAFGDRGLWEGSVYVFDGRGSIDVGSSPPIAECIRCGSASSRLQNCADPACRTQLVVCAECAPATPVCESHAPAPVVG